MSVDIHLSRVRTQLVPRREPYWSAPVERGKHIGFRKLANGTGTWIARRFDQEGGRYRQKALGQATSDFNYSRAKQAAESWFRDCELGIRDEPITVREACEDCVSDLEAEGRFSTANDANLRFKRNVYNHEISCVRLDRLSTARLKKWRNELGGAKSSQNRNLASLKAALNLAVTHNQVSPVAAQQWKAVRPHKGAANRRELYLDKAQRRALLEAAGGSVRDLIEAAMLTGSRPGELVRAKRSQFDHRTGTMTYVGKTGTRSVPLSPAAVKLFRRLAKEKLPTAYLLTRDDGKPWGHSDWDKPVREAAARAELPHGVVLYTLRHSWITEALRSGIPTLDVARLTGTSLPMIEAHYGHLVADSTRDRLARLQML